MKALEPYGTSPVCGPNVAALVIGRSLTRFVYHLSQAVLLTTGEFVPDGELSSWTYAACIEVHKSPVDLPRFGFS